MNSIDIIISAKDMASNALKKVNAEIASFSSRASQYLRDATEASNDFAVGLVAAGAGMGAMMKVGVDYNAQLELTTNKILAMTKSQEYTAEVMKFVEDQAAKSIFSFQDMGTAASALVPVAKQSGIALEDLVKQAEILGASNPLEGLSGASFALKEAMSGDFTSIIERFNLSRSTINRLKDEGVPAMEIIQKALADMGVDYSMVEKMAGSFHFRLEAVKDQFVMMAGEFSKPVFDLFSQKLAELNANLPNIKQSIQDFINVIVNNKEVIVGALAGALVPAFVALGASIGGVMLTLAPFMIAGALIAQNWEPIKAFFESLGISFSSFGGFVESVKLKIYEFISVITGLPNESAVITSALTTQWNTAKSILSSVFSFLSNAIKTAFAFIKSDILPLLQEFFGAVSTVLGWIKKAWETNFGGIRDFLTGITQSIGMILYGAWQVIKNAISFFLNIIQGDWKGAWENVKGITSGVGIALAGIVKGIWETIKLIFNTGKDIIIGIIKGLWDGIMGVFSGGAEWASTWASNFMQMFANGIKNGISVVTDAVAGVAQSLKEFLGFASPTEKGPASNSDKWAPNFVKMFKEGLEDGVSDIARASSELSQAMKDTLGDSSAFDAQIQAIEKLKSSYQKNIDEISAKMKKLKDEIASFNIGGSKRQDLENSAADVYIRQQEEVKKLQADLAKKQADKASGKNVDAVEIAELQAKISKIEDGWSKNADFIKSISDEVQEKKKLNEMDELSRMLYQFEIERQALIKKNEQEMQELIGQQTRINLLYEEEKIKMMNRLEQIFQETVQNRKKIEGVNADSLKKLETMFQENVNTVDGILASAKESSALTGYIEQMDKITSATERAVSAAKKASSAGLGSGALGAVASLATKFVSGIGQATPLGGTKFFAEGGIFNGFGKSGVVNSPTIGVAGEAGAEAIIPLSGGAVPVLLKGNKNQSSGGIVLNLGGIHIGGSLTSEGELINIVSKGIVSRLFAQGIRA